MKNTQKWPISLLFVCNRPKLNKFICSASLLAVMLGIFLLPKTAQMASITPDKILELTNRERFNAGLNSLRTDDRLTTAAVKKAEAILTNQIFDHTINGRKFSAWIKDAGYKYSLAGENLAIDFITSEDTVKAWMASINHRENILSKEYSDTGIAIAEGKFAGQNTIIVAQIFGAPLLKTPPIPSDIARLNEKISPRQNVSKNYLSFYKNLFGHFSFITAGQIALF
jgi:hypothetical protein